MNIILQTILNDTYSLSNLRHKMTILKSYLLHHFFGSAQMQFDAQDLSWLQSLQPEFFQNFNKNNIYETFTQLDKEINNFKVLTIYLTFEPDDQTILSIGAMVRTKFPNILLIDIKYDPNLIAGASFVWNGMQKDYSLRSTIQQRKEMILENLKKYLR